MKKKYSDLDIHFQFEGCQIDALNIIFEQLTRTIPSHSHGNGCYEIHYIPDGYGKLEADNSFYEIGPNTLYVTGPHIRHAQTPIPREPMQEYCVYLRIQKIHKEKTPSPLMDLFLSNRFWYGADSQGIRQLMENLFLELEQRHTGYLSQAQFLLSQLIICLVRNYERKQTPKATTSAHRLGDSRSVIIEEYFLYEYDHLSLDELADRLKLSQRQTQRLLSEYYGHTFQQKKTEARMSAAAILLGDKQQSITSISEKLGFSSPEHFAAEFKRYYGSTPRTFRNHL